MENLRAKIFLAECLFESIEDENYGWVFIAAVTAVDGVSFDIKIVNKLVLIRRNAKKMLVEYKADCNLIIPGREIAAIHYAAGMDNVSFAENVMKIMLKNGGACVRQLIDVRLRRKNVIALISR